MKAIQKLRRLLGCCEQDDTPEIIDDLYATTHTRDQLRDIFHTKLEMVADCRGITYFEAFVEHIQNEAKLDVYDRMEIEEYLWGKGLHNIDIKELLDAFYLADTTARG